jgi:serine/threonine protein phosphatase PrpC
MLQATVKVDIGTFHEKNDDCALINGHILHDGDFQIELNNNVCLAVICDGVGGEMFGNEAAQTTLEVSSQLSGDVLNEEDIRTNIYIANQRVMEHQRLDNDHSRMATTIAGVFIKDSDYIVFNVGDSRVYRFRNKYIYLLSKDHSLVQDLIDTNLIAHEDAFNHPNRNIINRFIGHPTDYLPNIKICEQGFLDHDILLICSDGISDVLLEEDFENILLQYNNKFTLLDCCKELVAKAIQCGSMDNLSVILIRKE